MYIVHVHVDTCMTIFIIITDQCTNGDIRLVNGSRPTEGRIEVCFGEVWGTIADALLDKTSALVVCRQLGYSDKCQYDSIVYGS